MIFQPQNTQNIYKFKLSVLAPVLGFSSLTCLSIMSMALCILKIIFLSLFSYIFFGMLWFEMEFLIKITGKQTHECSGKCFLSILISLIHVCVCIFVDAKYSLLIYDTKTRKKIQKHSWLYRRYTSNIGINKKNLVRQQS